MDRSTQKSFSFVNLKHPDDLKDEETQLRIRRLAMTEVGKARRKLKTKKARNEIVLEFRNPNEQRPDFDRIGGGSIDPFSSYPVSLDESSRALIANIFAADTNHASSLRGAWYPVGLSSAASFHNMLAISQNFIFQKLNGFYPSRDDALALTHYHKALQHAGEMMKSSENHTSDEAIGVVASFMCHQALLQTFTGGEWQQHRNALMRIVGLRGGLDTIKAEHLRIIVSWADLLGAFFQDIPPVVPLPEKWAVDSKSQPTSSRPFSAISLQWKKHLPMQIDWVTIFDDIVQLISLDHAFSEEQLTLAITSGSWLEPTLWRLLTIRPLNHGNERAHIMEEVCRLGTLLFLAPFWRVMGQNPVCTAALTHNLLCVLTKHIIEWRELKPLLLWTIYFAAVETDDLGERSQLIFMLAVLMCGFRLSTWEDLKQIVKTLLWVEKVFIGADDLIRDEVMVIVRQNFMRPALLETPPTFMELFPDEFGEEN